MKFDLTFLLQPNDKASFDKDLKCSMAKSSSSSLDSNPVSHSDETDGDNDHNNILATSMGTTRSTSIPLPSSHVPRTQSELQLSIDEEAAEQRDARMFYRLVNGIRERQQQQTSALHGVQWQNSFDQSISRIVQARLAPLGEGDRPSDNVPHTEDIITEPNELPQDNWSITGYEEEQTTPFALHGSLQEMEERDDDYPEDEGLFEMDF